MRISKIDIAIEHLKTAISLYRQGGCYYSVLHLAGAAEEIFGYEINRQNKKLGRDDPIYENALSMQVGTKQVMAKVFGDSIQSPKEIMSELNYPKNSTKHFTDEEETHVEFNARIEARELLVRAIFNHGQIFMEDDEYISDFEMEIWLEEGSEAHELCNRLNLK